MENVLGEVVNTDGPHARRKEGREIEAILKVENNMEKISITGIWKKEIFNCFSYPTAKSFVK